MIGKSIFPVLLIGLLGCATKPDLPLRSPVDSLTLIGHVLNLPITPLNGIPPSDLRAMISYARPDEAKGSIYCNLTREATTLNLSLTVLDEHHVIVFYEEIEGEDCHPAMKAELFGYEKPNWKRLDIGLPEVKEGDFYSHGNITNLALFEYQVLGDSLLLKVGLRGRGDGRCYDPPAGEKSYYDPSGEQWNRWTNNIINTIFYRKYSTITYKWDATAQAFTFVKKDLNPESVKEVAVDVYYEDARSMIKFLDSAGLGHYGIATDNPGFAFVNLVMEGDKLKYSPCNPINQYLSLGAETPSDPAAESFNNPPVVLGFSEEGMVSLPVIAVVNSKSTGRVKIFFDQNSEPYPVLTAEFDKQLGVWHFSYGSQMEHHLGFEFQKDKFGLSAKPCDP